MIYFGWEQNIVAEDDQNSREGQQKTKKTKTRQVVDLYDPEEVLLSDIFWMGAKHSGRR